MYGKYKQFDLEYVLRFSAKCENIPKKAVVKQRLKRFL